MFRKRRTRMPNARFSLKSCQLGGHRHVGLGLFLKSSLEKELMEGKRLIESTPEEDASMVVRCT